jgi:hypothetical protein
MLNCMASSITLTLGGEIQNGALILRPVLETVFLLDYFGMDRSLHCAVACGGRQSPQERLCPGQD